ncbi:MAG TPA: LCP family protein [Actinomycetales bacterium]|nr:LCP family protein [Actinomycetales bacterium]
MAQQAASSSYFPPRRELRAQARHARPLSRGRARHASGAGDGFGRLLAWTAAGALVPGLGFLASGRRRLGSLLLTGVFLVLAGVAALYVAGMLTDVGLMLAVRPNALLVLSVAFAVLGAVWALVILAGYRSLRHQQGRRRIRLSAGQHLVAGALVAALVAAVTVPTATAARYAMTQRSLVLNVFDEGPDRDPNLAAPDTAAADPWAGTPRINVLLLGSDAGADRIGTRPDTLITASIDTQTGDTVLFSLPRNLQGAPFPEDSPAADQFPRGFYPSGVGNCPENDCHINGVWTWAEDNPHLFPDTDEPGLEATRQVVGETLGLSIDYYALVDLQGFRDVVDALGGLEITVERPIPIGGGTNTVTGQPNPINGYIQPGRRTLDGHDTLWYARSREGSTDYDRIRRQRCVIAAAVDQANPATLARAFPDLAASAEQHVETDIRGSELDAFVELGLRVKDGELRSLPFTDDVITSGDADFERIRELVAQSLNPQPPADETPAPSASAPPSESPAPSDSPTSSGSPTTEAPDPQTAQDTSQVCG